MADTTTSTYGFTKPEVGASEDTWGGKINDNLDDLDDLLDGTTVVTGIKMDDTLSIVDNADNTKVVQFQVSGVTTATTRTFTFPDATGTFMLTSAIGSTVQGYDAGLASIAGLTTAADKMIYTTASDTYAVADLTSAGRALLDDADAAAQRTTLGLGTAAVANDSSDADFANDTSDLARRGLVATWVQTDRTQIIHVRDEQTATTAGGGATAGSWFTRVLNTVKTNTISGASLASNQITLPAGTYEVAARAPGFGVQQHVARLYDATGAAVLVDGAAAYSAGSQTHSEVWGRFTLSTTSAVQLEHRVANTAGGNGLGVAHTFTGTNNVYAEVIIRRVA